MTDPSSSLTPDDVEQAVLRTLDSWEIRTQDDDSITVRLPSNDSHTPVAEYEATVPLAGRLNLETVLDQNHRLLGIQSNIAVYLVGFENSRLVLKVNIQSQSQSDSDTEAE